MFSIFYDRYTLVLSEVLDFCLYVWKVVCSKFVSGVEGLNRVQYVGEVVLEFGQTVYFALSLCMAGVFWFKQI